MLAIIPVVVIAAALAVGFGYAKFSKKEDSMPEEVAESIIEAELEDVLDLPDGSLNGKIDISSNSPEKK